MKRAKWLGIVFGGVVLAGMTLWAFRTTPEVQVETALVTLGPITHRVVASGTVQPVTTVQVGSQVSGSLQSLDADFNSSVKKGQVIATIDPTLFRAQLLQAQASLSSAKAQLAVDQSSLIFQRMALERNTDLRTTGVFAQEALDTIQATVDGCEAQIPIDESQIEQAAAQASQAQANLDHTVIRSPIDGIVLARYVDVGQTIAASIQAPVLFSIASDLTHVQVYANIDKSDVGGLTPGEPVTFDVESYPDETFAGTLTEMRLQPVAQETQETTSVTTSTASAASTAVTTAVSYTAIIEVANADERLKPGMTADVVLGGSRRQNAVRVPNSALAFQPSAGMLQVLGETAPFASDEAPIPGDDGARSPYVWMYDGRHFAPVALQLGLADGQWTELLGGSIRPGDALVTSAVQWQRSRF
jgi:HlyD family secretion protein